MTKADVQKRLLYFTEGAPPSAGWWDDEEAHSKEDDLYADVLQAIADGTAEDPRAMAEMVLTTQQCNFARWYA